MYPVLFHLGPIPIHTYGFLIAMGFLTGIAVCRRLLRGTGIPEDRDVDLAFWVLLVGFIGTRVLFVITQLDYYLAHPLDIFKVWQGGLVFYGGPLTATPFAVWYIRKYRLPFWKTMDAFVPGVVIAQAFGRMGCLAAGCCYGKETHTDYGIQLFSGLVDEKMRGINLHPTQIYSSFSLFVFFLFMVWTYRRKKFDGQVVLTYFMGYPIIRSIIEIYRGDLVRGFVIDNVLSTSQFISIIVFLIATVVLVLRLKKIQNKND
ncbi:MAG: prolipoprotein diacylglyceryl transferase [Bdellovibrionaceae bacterium]|nr:prolipoprotein diacylglyceryl transferase [Pseudobdellovibrionaceae bacterium]